MQAVMYYRTEGILWTGVLFWSWCSCRKSWKETSSLSHITHSFTDCLSWSQKHLPILFPRNMLSSNIVEALCIFLFWLTNSYCLLNIEAEVFYCLKLQKNWLCDVVTKYALIGPEKTGSACTVELGSYNFYCPCWHTKCWFSLASPCIPAGAKVCNAMAAIL